MKTSYIVKHIAGSLVFFLIIFICAGRIDYLPGLIYLAIGIIMTVLNYTLLKPGSELLAERGKPGEGIKKWDKIILLVSFLLTIAMYAVAGLDSGRYHWSPDFHLILPIIGIICTASGQLLFLTAQKQNKFFSSTVRIQSEREHTVCDAGLYRIVRHPAYMGSIIQAIGFPLLFESLWSIIPASLLVVTHFMRTFLEDKTLKDELPGYIDYSGKILYRIIPGLW
jgi:protein-S-isoprenylcysteine O-methyltransferase Ste14